MFYYTKKRLLEDLITLARLEGAFKEIHDSFITMREKQQER